MLKNKIGNDDKLLSLLFTHSLAMLYWVRTICYKSGRTASQGHHHHRPNRRRRRPLVDK